MNVAVFGGSFNPPHIAHVLACAVLLAVEDVERVIVVPTYRHPFAKSLEAFEERMRMCELAMGWLPNVEVSAVERDIGGESLTLRTLEHLSRENPGYKLRLVMGADILAEVSRWYGFEEIQRIAPPLVLARAGIAGPPGGPTLLPEVSSTYVRAAIANEAWGELKHLVPGKVLALIREHKLYGAERAERTLRRE